MKKPKLLIVGAFPPENSQIYGGIVTTCRALLQPEFSNLFDLVLIDSTQRSNPPPVLLLRSFFASVRFCHFFYKLITVSPDAVLIFTSVGVSVLEKGVMARFARLKRIPVLLFPRGAELISIVNRSAFQRAWTKPAMRGATHLLCQGATWQQFAVNVLGFSSDTAPIIHNWSATPELLLLGAEKKKCLSNKFLNIVFVGWIEKEKGVFEMLEACRLLAQNHQFVLTIAGRGSAEQAARDFVKQHSLSACIRFAGWVQDETKQDLLRNSDILLLPSWIEGFPNAVIEAMAAKLAVIVTTVGIVPDLLNDRQQALLIPSKNIEAIVTALEELLIDEAFRISLADRGYHYAKETFSTDAGVSRLAMTIIDAIEISRTKRCVE